MSLTVVYARDTGHVLGALALTGPAGPPPAIAALVGKQLPVRVGLRDGKNAELPVPAGRLDVAAVDDTPDTLVDPFGFGVELTSDGVPKSALLPLADWPEASPVSLSADGVSIKLPTPAPTDLQVLVVVAGGAQVHLVPSQILARDDHTTVAMTLASGQEYGVLTLVQRWVGRLEALHF